MRTVFVAPRDCGPGRPFERRRRTPATHVRTAKPHSRLHQDQGPSGIGIPKRPAVQHCAQSAGRGGLRWFRPDKRRGSPGIGPHDCEFDDGEAGEVPAAPTRVPIDPAHGPAPVQHPDIPRMTNTLALVRTVAPLGLNGPRLAVPGASAGAPQASAGHPGPYSRRPPGKSARRFVGTSTAGEYEGCRHGCPDGAGAAEVENECRRRNSPSQARARPVQSGCGAAAAGLDRHTGELAPLEAAAAVVVGRVNERGQGPCLGGQEEDFKGFDLTRDLKGQSETLRPDAGAGRPVFEDWRKVLAHEDNAPFHVPG